MPQISMLPEYPTMTGMRLTVLPPLPGLRDVTRIVVEVSEGGSPYFTVASETWEGITMDYASTLAEEVMTSFLYGEKAHDVGRAYHGVRKVARAHARRYQF